MKKFYLRLIGAMLFMLFGMFAQAQPPANSTCATAQPITVGVGTCSSILYTNVGAGSSGLPAVPSCWSPTTANNTVWFSMVATSTDIEVSTNFGGTLANTQLAVFSGSCGALTQIACEEDINTAGGLFHTDVILHGLTIGNTYYMAVDGNANTTGTFRICAQQSGAVTPPGPKQDCETAQFLCDHSSVSVADGPGGTGSIETLPTCFGAPGERSSNWYTFTALTSGTLAFTINPNTNIDYDFAVFNSTAGCPGTELSCNWSPTSPVTGLGCAGGQCNPTLTLTAGQTYSILVDRYTSTSASGFTLDFTGTTATFGAPTASFTATTVCIGSATTFTNNTVGSNTYSWNFGDGSTSSATNPTHVYATAGTYTVTLLISTNPGGCQNAVSSSVTVNPMPTASVVTNSPVCSGGNAVFTVSGTANAVVTYNINSGANQLLTLSGAGSGTVTVAGVVANTTLNLVSANLPVAPANENAIAAVTAQYPANAIGGLQAAGTTATTLNSAQINSTYTSGVFTLAHTVPAGTSITISIAKNNAASSVTITDGTASLAFNTGTLDVLQYVTFVTGVATNTITINRLAGSTWVDGLQYTYVSPGCTTVIPGAYTVIVTTTAAPTVTTPLNYCQNAAASALTATGVNLLWYTAAVGGVGSATAPTPSTAAVGSTIYYVTQTVGSCESPRAAITVTISSTPLVPVVSSPVIYCQGAASGALTATGTNLLWYANAVGGVGSGAAPTPSTAAVGSTIYYVSQTTGTCEGPRATITVTVNATPVAPTVSSPLVYCQGVASSALTATGTNLLWYANAVGGVGSATAPTPSTAAVGSTTYYVSQTIGTCEGPRAAITVTINATPAAPTVSSPIVYCQGVASSALTATGTNLLWYANAVGGVGSATAPTPSTAAVGSTTYYVSQTTGTCEGPRAAITVTINATPVAPTVSSPVVYCQGTVASALTATGTNLLWYANPVGGVGSATAPTPSTGAVGSITYYVSQTTGTCEGPRAAITVTVNATPAAPIVSSPVVYCQGAASSALTATGTNLLWYANAVGGVGSATAPTPSTAAVGSTIYYVSQTSGCEGPRAAITVTVNTTPAAPIVSSPAVYCQGVVSSALTAAGTNLLWYANAVGGVGSATAPTPSTAAVGSTIYYVSQTTGTCEGPRAAITVTINATPAAPIVSSPVIYCQGVASSALTATGTNLLWYANAVGGVGSGTAPTPSTAAVGSTTYYVSQTTGSCEGPRAAITVTINTTPAAPIISSPVVYCEGVVSSALTAAGTNLLWYANAVGGVGSATAPTPSTAVVGSTTYYVSQTTGTCEGPRASITVTVNATPSAPLVSSPVIYCQGTTASVLSAAGTNLLWYANALGGVGSATAPTPPTAAVGSTTYYVSQTSGCEGPRAAITVTVNTTPTAPIVSSPVVYCESVVSSALTAAGTNLLWYANVVGGVGSGTAPTPSTAVVGSTTYYVSQTTGTCEGPRAAITVTVNATPLAPLISSPVIYCQGTTASVLSAAGTNLLWYANAVGGVGSATAPTPSTAAVGSTIYYVSQTSGCEGPRAAITVTVNTTPAAPIVSSPVVYCQGVASSALTATGTNLLWYANAVGGVGSATAPTPSTAAVGSITYYVSQTTGSCECPRAAITVTVNSTPTAPIVSSPVVYCQGAAASALSATGTNLLWYASGVGGVGSATAPTPSTAAVGSTTYYVSQTNGTCESPRAAITLTVNATPAAPIVSSPVVYCEGVVSLALTAAGTNLLWYANAVGGVGSATAPTPSTAAVGSTIYYVSQTTGTCEGPRAAITVIVNTTPLAPIVSSPVVYCQGAAASALSATGANLLWYANAVGGVGSATAPTPSTAAVGSIIYYVSQTTGACEGPRAAITVTINATPTAPIVSSPVVYCQGVAASGLTAAGTNLLWYANAVGGVGSATAPTPSTAAVGSIAYYVSQTTGTCEGPRAAITVTVNTTPAAPIVSSPIVYCEGVASSALTAAGTNLLWYANAVGGVGSVTAPTPSTAAVGSTTYYVSQTTGTCEGPRAAITVTINATPVAPVVSSPVVYCQGTVATALTATGTNLLWYANAVGGVGSATAPTPSTAAVGSTIYYVSQTTGTCEGPRAAITVTVNATPAAPIVSSPVVYCQGVVSSSLTAVGTNLLWYTNAVGGAGSPTAPTPSTTSVGSVTYYVSQTTGSCEGPRAAITVTINPTPAAPIVSSPVVYCEGVASSALTATGTNLLWYSNAVGGVGSATAPTPSTAAVGSTIYYVSQTTGTCEGPRAAITVTINATPAAPIVSSPVAYCQGVASSALTATGTNLLWYANAVGGVGSATAPTPSTAAVGSTIYYVSQTTGTCEGARAAITVTVNTTPAAPIVSSPIVYCEGVASSALTATGTNLLWYANAVGGIGSGTAPTPSTAAVGSTIYYVSQTTGTCEGPRAAITVTVNSTPTAPIVSSPVIYCQGAAASVLTATGTNLLWYASAVGGVGSATAPTPSTAAVGSITYYVSQTTGTCEGPRAAITVTVNATPAAPIVSSPVVYCQGVASSALTATGTNLLWYSNAAGGVGSATGPTPSTSTVGSTTYYVSQTTGSCEGPRAAITVTINPTPAAPIVSSPVVYCQGVVSSSLTATGTNLLWYAIAVGGVGSVTAPTPSTTSVGSVTYYVSQTLGSCEGPRAAITVTINPTPAAPIVSSPIVYCQGVASSALTAGGTNLLWYANAIGGVGSVIAPTPSTASVGTVTYYVSQTTGTCEGPRAAITVTVNATPAAPIVSSPVVYCQGVASSALTATGTNLLWYSNAAGGVGSATAPTPSSATVGSTTFYVSQTTGTCEGPRAAITVTINATPAAPIVSSPVVYCQGVASSALTAGGTNLLWYTNAAGGVGSATAPTPSTAAVGSTTYYVSQTTGTCEGPRAAITVTINATPAAPVVSSPVIYCQGTVATALTTTGTNLLWYANAVGGIGTVTAPTPSTATVGSTTYYVSQTTGTCEGPRGAITVTIKTTPGAPIVSSPVNYCQGVATSALSATGTNLLWYANAVGGVGSATAPTPSSATVGSTTFYVSQTTGTCEGPRAAITVTVNTTPAAPIVSSPVVYCQGAPSSALTAIGSNLLWYPGPLGGIGSALAPTPSTSITGNVTYYVSQTTGTCQGPRAAITVTVNPTPAAPTVSSPVTYCQGAAANTLTAVGTNLLWYANAVGGVGSATAPTPSTATVGSTTYYVSQTTGTCEGPRGAITVTIKTTPGAPIVSSPVNYCQGVPSSILSATGTNLLWYTNAPGGTGSATAPTPSTVALGSTTYYVSQTTGTCEGPRAAIVVNVNATPAAPTVSSPVIYCEGVTASPLTAIGTNLLWYANASGGAGSATAPTPSTAAVGTINYYVSQTTGTCQSTRATISVIVNIAPQINAGADSTICEGDSLLLQPVVNPAAEAYNWITISPGIPATTISSPNTQQTYVHPANNAIYVISGNIGACLGHDTVRVNVRWKPAIDAGPNVAICTPGSTQLKGIVTHASNPNISFSWTPTDSLATPTAIQTIADPINSTWFTITATMTKAGYGCDFTVSDSVKVIVAPPVRAFAGNDTIAVKDIPHQLYGSGGTQYYWTSPTAIFNNPQTQNPTVVLHNDANVFLEVKNALGCSATDTVFIKVYEGPTYYVPTAFTPNGDGLNDVFRVIPVGIATTTSLKIFNRYGAVMFETNEYLKGWDGTNHGMPQPQGTYIWVVTGLDRYNRAVSMKGSVILIR